MEYNWRSFPNIGYITSKFTEEQLFSIKKEINEIKTDFKKYEHRRFNKNLAGNILHSFSLESSHENLSNLVLPMANVYDAHCNYLKNFTYTSNSHPFILTKCWVNFQKKYEFNPTHFHSGILSFVIYINIPYNCEDELKHSSSVDSKNPSAGMFHFVYSDCIGGICVDPIVIDKSMENTIILFPAKMAHHVYPFYTSDDYRISISGNIILDI